jgi:hypothetical protein
MFWFVFFWYESRQLSNSMFLHCTNGSLVQSSVKGIGYYIRSKMLREVDLCPHYPVRVHNLVLIKYTWQLYLLVFVVSAGSKLETWMFVYASCSVLSSICEVNVILRFSDLWTLTHIWSLCDVPTPRPKNANRCLKFMRCCDYLTCEI